MKKIGGWLFVVLVALFVFKDPAGAAEWVKTIFGGLGEFAGAFVKDDK
ncbi:hypothetical protein [Longispora albida]|nr:hypothetical protein [Longispora albida]